MMADDECSCMMACSYFVKDLPRLMRQKNDGDCTQYPITEFRGAALGIVGYGDIGRAFARLAKAYKMLVLGLKTEEDRVVILHRSILRSCVRHWRAARNAIEEQLSPCLCAVDRTLVGSSQRRHCPIASPLPS